MYNPIVRLNTNVCKVCKRSFKNEKALKEAIVKLMTNEKLRKKLEINARKKALKYSWDKVARETHNVYKEVLK